MCDGLCDELNDFRKQLEVGTTEPDYEQFLLFTLSGVKGYKPRKTGMVDDEHICGENDDSDEASDHQYELFFESLNKYEKSYVLEGKIIDVSASAKYEGDSKFGRKRKPKCERKLSKDNGRVDGAADQSPRLPNEQAPVNQHASDNVNYRRNEISKKKPDLRNKGIIKDSDVGFSKALSKKMDNLGGCKLSKNMNVVQEDNIVTYSQSEPHAQARLRKAGNEENVDKAHYVPDSESAIRISYDGNRYQSPDPRNNSESKNKSEPVGQAQPIKREKGLKGKNVVLSKHKPDTENHLYLKPDPKHNSATKYQVVRANQVVQSEKDKEIQIKTNMPRVKGEKNVFTDDYVGNRRAVNYKDNGPLYPKPSPEKNLEEHQYEDADVTQPGKKHTVQRHRKLRKVAQGSHEIKVDDAAIRNDVAHIENKPLFHKPCPRKNQVTKNCIDQACPKPSHSMLMKERVITDDSDSDVEILDSASFYRAGNPGPFVTSKKFHKSMIEDNNIKLLGRTSPRFDFKKQVMIVLRKPYDKQESNRLREAFMAGSYVKFHPDLVKKLAAHRFEKGKCLAILRGFFFWLENLTKQGSFKPWKDRECLGVDPPLL